MSVESRCFELAKQGYSNAEIFGDIELSMNAMTALQKTKPTIFFEILKGRALHTQEILEKIRLLAYGWEEDFGPQPSLAALQVLLTRADKNNTALTAGYELQLLSGFNMEELEQQRTRAEVTELLRKRS